MSMTSVMQQNRSMFFFMLVLECLQHVQQLVLFFQQPAPLPIPLRFTLRPFIPVILFF